MTDFNLEQLRKQARERVRRAGGEKAGLADAQPELAPEHGSPIGPTLTAPVEQAGAEQPLRTEIEYYEERAAGIASVNGLSVAEARRDLARRHGSLMLHRRAFGLPARTDRGRQA